MIDKHSACLRVGVHLHTGGESTGGAAHAGVADDVPARAVGVRTVCIPLLPCGRRTGAGAVEVFPAFLWAGVVVGVAHVSD